MHGEIKTEHKQSLKWQDVKGKKIAIECNTPLEIELVGSIMGIETPNGRQAIACDSSCCMAISFAKQEGYELVIATNFIQANTTPESCVDNRSDLEINVNDREETVINTKVINGIKYEVAKGFDGWHARFHIGVQSFSLREVESEEHGWWYCTQLQTAFAKIIPPVIGEAIEIGQKYFPELEPSVQDAINQTTRHWLSSDISSLVEKETQGFNQWSAKAGWVYIVNNDWYVNILENHTPESAPKTFIQVYTIYQTQNTK